jgi:hypothetical protein
MGRSRQITVAPERRIIMPDHDENKAAPCDGPASCTAIAGPAIKPKNKNAASRRKRRFV